MRPSPCTSMPSYMRRQNAESTRRMNMTSGYDMSEAIFIAALCARLCSFCRSFCRSFSGFLPSREAPNCASIASATARLATTWPSSVRRWEKSGPSAATFCWRSRTRRMRAVRRARRCPSPCTASPRPRGSPKSTTMWLRETSMLTKRLRREVAAQCSEKSVRISERRRLVVRPQNTCTGRNSMSLDAAAGLSSRRVRRPGTARMVFRSRGPSGRFRKMVRRLSSRSSRLMPDRGSGHP